MLQKAERVEVESWRDLIGRWGSDSVAISLSNQVNFCTVWTEMKQPLLCLEDSLAKGICQRIIVRTAETKMQVLPPTFGKLEPARHLTAFSI